MSTNTGTAEAAAKVTGVEGFNADAHVETMVNTSQEEMIHDFARDQVVTFLTALNEGKLPCQPRENSKDSSYADTWPARNVIWDNKYHGMNQFMLKVEQEKQGYKTGDFLTKEAGEKAYEFYARKHGITLEGIPLLKKDAVPVVIMVADKGMPKFVSLHNIESFGEPQAIREYAGHLRELEQERLKQLKGENYYLPKPKGHDNGVVVCKNTEPVMFLAQWEAACSTGKGFKVSPEQNAAFVKACNEYINKPLDNGQQNSPAQLTKLMTEASRECKAFIPTLFQKKESPEQGQKSPERTAAMAAEAAVGW